MTLRGVGPGLVLAAVLAGIGTGFRAGPASAGLLLVAAVAMTVAGVGVRGPTGAVLVCIGAACAGSALTCRALNGLEHSPLVEVVAERRGAAIDVTLVDDPDTTRWSARALGRVALVRPERGAHFDGGGRTIVIDASDVAAARLAVLQAGDRARLVGYFRPLDPFEARLRWRHAVGAFSAHDLTKFAGPSSPLMAVANALRAQVLAGHRSVPEPQRALIAGFLLGDTSDVPDDLVNDFRAAGLTHLVAVSGENVAFVLVLVGPLLRRFPMAGRFVAGITVLLVFGTMTRWEPSVLRACAMAACSMVALTLGRPTAGLRALALAATVLLLADPFLIRSVGFVLSCAASMGIAVFGPPITAWLPGPRWLRESLGVTVGAQLAVAPVLVAVFGGVPLVAVPANLAAAPLVGPLTLTGLVSGLAGGVLGGLLRMPMVGAVASFAPYVLVSGVIAIARVAARVPMTVGPVALGAGAVVGLGAFAWRALRRATWRRARPVRAQSRVALPAGRNRARPHPPHAGDGHPEPHPGLVLRPRRDVRAR